METKHPWEGDQGGQIVLEAENSPRWMEWAPGGIVPWPEHNFAANYRKDFPFSSTPPSLS